MTRLALAGGLVALVAAVALVLNRRRAVQAPSGPRRFSVPAQVDRRDFGGASAPWLLAVFTSDTCDSCERMVSKLEPVASAQVHLQVVPWQLPEGRALHDRYAIEAVPASLLADGDGVVRWSMIGSDVTVTDLWSALAAARDGNPASSCRE